MAEFFFPLVCDHPTQEAFKATAPASSSPLADPSARWAISFWTWIIWACDATFCIFCYVAFVVAELNNPGDTFVPLITISYVSARLALLICAQLHLVFRSRSLALGSAAAKEPFILRCCLLAFGMAVVGAVTYVAGFTVAKWYLGQNLFIAFLFESTYACIYDAVDEYGIEFDCSSYQDVLDYTGRKCDCTSLHMQPGISDQFNDQAYTALRASGCDIFSWALGICEITF